MRKYRINNPEKIKGIKRKYRIRHKEEIKESKKIYYDDNIDKIKEYNINKRDKAKARERSRLYRKDNPEKVKEAISQWCRNNRLKINKYIRKWSREKRRIDRKYNLNRRISNAINYSLKGNKNNRHWESLVGYALNDLIKRLKFTLPKGYTWQDYLKGELHIDHIIPISAFNFDNPNQIDFQNCWELSNLQLLPAKENLIKSNKLYKTFQPALRI